MREAILEDLGQTCHMQMKRGPTEGSTDTLSIPVAMETVTATKTDADDSLHKIKLKHPSS